MTVRDVLVEYRNRTGLQYCESPREADLLDRLERRADLPGAAMLAAVALGLVRR